VSSREFLIFLIFLLFLKILIFVPKIYKLSRVKLLLCHMTVYSRDTWLW